MMKNRGPRRRMTTSEAFVKAQKKKIQIKGAKKYGKPRSRT